MADFFLRITLTAADGAQGVQIYTGPASAPMAWDRETSAETTGAVIELIDAHGEVVDERDLDGDEWRAFEEGDGLAKVHRWMNCSKFYGGLGDCLLAAQMGTDPDGWTDAHDELLRLQGARTAAVDDGGPKVRIRLRRYDGQWYAHAAGGPKKQRDLALWVAISYCQRLNSKVLQSRTAVRHG